MTIAAVRYRKQYIMEDFDFDRPVRLRVFMLTDVLQITIIDEEGRDVFVPLSLADLPLNL